MKELLVSELTALKLHRCVYIYIYTHIEYI